MNRKKLRQLAKQINYGKEVNIKFIYAPPECFFYETTSDTVGVSSLYDKLDKEKILAYLTHEIGHKNTVPSRKHMSTSDYYDEYEAHRWAMYRLDELGWKETFGEYRRYLQELSSMTTADEEEEEYQEAAVDVLQELELV